MKQGSEKHIDSLDGLRGLAILLVFEYLQVSSATSSNE
jgi:peptidoglycan/LPS O-acetylase OafA/YrhL